MNPVSKRRASQLRQYAKKRLDWIQDKDCELCTINAATDVHHARGRLHDMLLETKHWRALCRSCHAFVTANPKWAMEHGYSEDRLAR